MALRFAKDGQRVYVANYLAQRRPGRRSAGRKVERTIDLGGPAEPSLARQGEAIFYDGRRSLDQWYSCHSCHYEGHTNALAMDTRNDGRNGNYKIVLSLRNVTRTGPWTWHGWQKDIETAMHKSLTDSMLGKAPTDDEIKALVAYLDTLAPPPNPHRGPDGKLSRSRPARRAASSTRPAASAAIPARTSPTARSTTSAWPRPGDAYKGFNPPSLLGCYDRVLYLHDGRAKSLEEVLQGPHSPAKVTGQHLTDDGIGGPNRVFESIVVRCLLLHVRPIHRVRQTVQNRRRQARLESQRFPGGVDERDPRLCRQGG